jgi:CrcB protein
MLSNGLVVAIGGAVGALLRFYVSESMPTDTFPWGTLTVNLVGSVILGVLTGLLASNMLSEQQALLLGVGVLGAFTTLSTFSVEAATMVDEGRWAPLAAYVGLTGIAGPVLALLAWKTTTSLT